MQFAYTAKEDLVVLSDADGNQETLEAAEPLSWR